VTAWIKKNGERHAVRKSRRSCRSGNHDRPGQAPQCNHDSTQSTGLAVQSTALTEMLKCFPNIAVNQENISCLSNTLNICLLCSAACTRRPRSQRATMSSHQPNEWIMDLTTSVCSSFVGCLSWSFCPLSSWLARIGCYSFFWSDAGISLVGEASSGAQLRLFSQWPLVSHHHWRSLVSHHHSSSDGSGKRRCKGLLR
jgi:hypothetical protein